MCLHVWERHAAKGVGVPHLENGYGKISSLTMLIEATVFVILRCHIWKYRFRSRRGNRNVVSLEVMRGLCMFENYHSTSRRNLEADNICMGRSLEETASNQFPRYLSKGEVFVAESFDAFDHRIPLAWILSRNNFEIGGWVPHDRDCELGIVRGGYGVSGKKGIKVSCQCSPLPTLPLKSMCWLHYCLGMGETGVARTGKHCVRGRDWTNI